MRIFLTGSSGFVGSHLYKSLSKTHNIHCMRSNLLDFEKVSNEIAAFNPDIVIHLAFI
jgi:dTDP-4-dehydrorhamnose reductase